MKASKPVNSYLFVYGTLRNGFDLPLKKELASELEYIGKSEIKGRLYDIGEYPGAKPSTATDSAIKGDIFRLYHPRKVLKVLDEYEGYDSHDLDGSEYFRTKETVETADGKKLKVWVYWYNHPVIGKKRIHGNDYLQYLKQKKSA